MATNVNVRLFAGLQNMVGARNVALSLPSGATVETLRDQIVEEYPVLQAFINTLVIAVGEEIVPIEQVLDDGAQVELIPPISGGSVVQFVSLSVAAPPYSGRCPSFHGGPKR